MNKCVTSHKKLIENTVCILCETIKTKINKEVSWTEYSLRRELIACILGSQVRYETAMNALERIEHAGLLDDDWWNNDKDQYEIEIYKTLAGKMYSTQKGSYRFPHVRAHQIAQTRNTFCRKSIKELLFKSTEPKKIRRNLVDEISGLGPKQASMFMRNIGLSYDLAILDSHVLNFLKMQNSLYDDNLRISSIAAYERIENIAIDYAESLGYPVGFLDWAIWATMKAVKEINL